MTLHRSLLPGILAACALAIGACTVWAPSPTPSAADADRFLADVGRTMLRLGIEQQRAAWVAQNFITVDTQALSARANQLYTEAIARAAKEAVKYDNVEVSPDARRQLGLLKVALTVATPADEKESGELTSIMASMDATYGKGKWCKDPSKPGECLDIGQITDLLATSRDPKAMRDRLKYLHANYGPLPRSSKVKLTLQPDGSVSLNEPAKK